MLSSSPISSSCWDTMVDPVSIMVMSMELIFPCKMYNCKYSKQVQVILMCCTGTIKYTIRQKVLPTGILCYTYFTWCNLSLLLYLNIFTYCHHNSVPWVHTYGRYTPLSPFLDTIYLLTAPNLCAASTFIAHLFHDPFILNIRSSSHTF